MGRFIGVDVGGTLLRAACFDQDFNLLNRVEQPTGAGSSSDEVLARLMDTIRAAFPEEGEQPSGIGLALPSPVNPEKGIIHSPPNLPFKELPILQLVEEAVGGPVFIGNDADLAGLAEYEIGAGRGSRTMVYMTISTGIGGGLILDGRLHTGGGLAGEIGHTVIDPDGPICGCGKQGHLEAVASGTGIARIARERLAAGEESQVMALAGGDLQQVTAKVVGQAAQAGDRMALEIITQAGRYVGVSIASLMMLLNPDLFVLGGGVTKLGNLLFDPIHEAVRKYAMNSRYWENTPIVPAQLGGDVGLYGAAALVKMRLG